MKDPSEEKAIENKLAPPEKTSDDFRSARAEEPPVVPTPPAPAAEPDRTPQELPAAGPADIAPANDEAKNEESLDLDHDQPNVEPTGEAEVTPKPRKGMHRKEETLVTMLELLSGNKNNVEVNENAITEQKEKVEHIISELQTKMQQITLDDPTQPATVPEQEAPAMAQEEDQRKSALKMIEQDIVGQFDLTLGKINGGIANLYCPDKLQIVQIPTCFIPRGTKAGNIVTISIARKKAEEDVRTKTILEIQEALNKYSHDFNKAK